MSQRQIDLNKIRKKAKEIKKKKKKKWTETSRPNTFEATRVANGDEPNDVVYTITYRISVLHPLIFNLITHDVLYLTVLYLDYF